MRESSEVRAAKSLYSEYQRILKLSNTPGIPEIEKSYFLKMAAKTNSKIDHDLLNSPKKYKKQWQEYEY